MPEKKDKKFTDAELQGETKTAEAKDNLKLEPPAVNIEDEDAVKWFNQIQNLENAKVGAKLAKEQIQKRYSEAWYKKESKNGSIQIMINGIPVKWEDTYTKANPKPKPIEEKHGTQFVMKFPKKKKSGNGENGDK